MDSSGLLDGRLYVHSDTWVSTYWQLLHRCPQEAKPKCRNVPGGNRRARQGGFAFAVLVSSCIRFLGALHTAPPGSEATERFVEGGGKGSFVQWR